MYYHYTTPQFVKKEDLNSISVLADGMFTNYTTSLSLLLTPSSSANYANVLDEWDLNSRPPAHQADALTN